MDCRNFEITFPDDVAELDQDEEYVTLISNESRENVLLHDYQRVYEIPGLYEEVLYNRLGCCSPQMLCNLMQDAIASDEDDNSGLRVLDFGAGNGVAGERLKEDIGCEVIVGVDILPEAKSAALRDRPKLYHDYMVADFTNLDEQEKEKLANYAFNALFSVAALGYDHIGTEAFLNAFELVSQDAWVTFNIKDRFLSEEDDTGFRDTIGSLIEDRLDVMASKRYVHRFSIGDEPLYYVGMVGKKR